MRNELLEFRKNAILGKIGQPLCDDFKAAWRRCGDDKESLVRLALMQQSQPYLSTACHENLGLSKQYILSNFGEYINGKKTFHDVDGVKGYTYRIYVGYGGRISDTPDVTGLMWCDGATIDIEKSKCPVLYVSNGSDVPIVCSGYNSPKIYLFDDSSVTIDESDDTCDVIAYNYGNGTVSTGKYCLKEPKVFNKQLKL